MSIKRLVKSLLQKSERGEKVGELTVDEVLNIVKNYFERYERKKGSHIKVQDQRLKKFKEHFPDDELFSLNGEFIIPTKGGKKVKQWYVKRLLEAIEIIQLMEQESE
ncbi:hypothetical protein CEE45_16980 [Candidatus Heimdallarchaeota archaeon B3_Heim]|nr:MAG: hypothetical protein CEE45_16980 [Candidatus Heimdallarchaeota archaeon B3_Heim]